MHSLGHFCQRSVGQKNHFWVLSFAFIIAKQNISLLAISVFSSVSPPEAYVDFSMATERRIKNSRMTVEWQMVGLSLFFWVSSGRRCEGPCFHSKASVLLWSLSWRGLKARWHFYGCICREKHFKNEEDDSDPALVWQKRHILHAYFKETVGGTYSFASATNWHNTSV